MNINQLILFEIVVQYKAEDNDTTRKRQSIIMYLEERQNLQEITISKYSASLHINFTLTSEKH